MTDRVIAVLDGKLAAAGGIRAIRAAMADIPHRVQIDVDEPRRLGRTLIDLDNIVSVRIADQTIELETEDLGFGRRAFLHAVDAVGTVHAAILRIQAIMLPIQTLVLNGH